MNLTKRAKKLVALDGDALLRSGASSVLAFDEGHTNKTLALLANEAADEPPGEQLGIVRIEGPLAQRALIDMCAYVDGYDAVTARVQRALAHPEVGSLLLVIDSPGGDVAGLEEAVRRMRAAADEADKPVVAYVDELAASAAYWIAACVADEVHVPVSGRVGSIGCIGAWVDTSKAQEKAGISWHVIRDPEGKAEMAPAAPVAKLADERLTESVRSASGRFADAVAARRGLDSKAVRALNAAVFEGAKGVGKGLADVVGTLEGAAGRARELATQRRKQRSEKKKMDMTARMAVLFGLSATATTEQVMEAAETTAKDIVSATGAKDLAHAAGAVDALKVKAEAHAKASAELAELKAQAAVEKKTAEVTKRKDTLDAAVKAGKVTPVKRAELEAKAEKYGQEWLDALIDDLPAKVSVQDTSITIAADVKPAPVSAELKVLLDKQQLTTADHQAAVEAGF